MIGLIKRGILSALDRAGYTLLKRSDYDALAWFVPRVDRLEEKNSELQIANSELHETVREFRDQPLQDVLEGNNQLMQAYSHVQASLEDLETEFKELYDRYGPYSSTSAERLHALYKAVAYIVEAGIPGDIVESGVFKGGSMMMAASVLLAMGQTDRRLVLFDTFAGHPQPDPELDVDLWGTPAEREWQKQIRPDGTSDWSRASLDEVRANMEQTGYPMDNVIFVEGMVEQTLPEYPPTQIALLRLDTDWYASTKAALEHLYPMLSEHGILIIDDYGHYQGVRQATDEFFASTDHSPLLNRIDYSCRVAVKPR